MEVKVQRGVSHFLRVTEQERILGALTPALPILGSCGLPIRRGEGRAWNGGPVCSDSQSSLRDTARSFPKPSSPSLAFPRCFQDTVSSLCLSFLSCQHSSHCLAWEEAAPFFVNTLSVFVSRWPRFRCRPQGQRPPSQDSTFCLDQAFGAVALA